MKISIEGSVITQDFETAGVDVVVLDVNTLPDAVKAQAMLFGFQTALRNATAGKLEEVAKAVESVHGRVKTWQAGSWLSQAESKAAVELSKDEKSAIIASVIVLARRAQGDTRTDEEILTAFNGLDEARQGAIVAALQKPIDKRIKDQLRQKKVLAKSGSDSAVNF